MYSQRCVDCLQSVMPLFVSHVTRVEGYRRNAVTLSVLSLFLNFSGRHIIDTLLDYFTCHVSNTESGLRLPKSWTHPTIQVNIPCSRAVATEQDHLVHLVKGNGSIVFVLSLGWAFERMHNAQSIFRKLPLPHAEWSCDECFPYQPFKNKVNLPQFSPKLPLNNQPHTIVLSLF